MDISGKSSTYFAVARSVLDTSVIPISLHRQRFFFLVVVVDVFFNQRIYRNSSIFSLNWTSTTRWVNVSEPSKKFSEVPFSFHMICTENAFGLMNRDLSSVFHNEVNAQSCSLVCSFGIFSNLSRFPGNVSTISKQFTEDLYRKYLFAKHLVVNEETFQNQTACYKCGLWIFRHTKTTIEFFNVWIT